MVAGVDAFFERVAAWAAPGLAYDSRVSKDWMFMSSDAMLAGTALYLAIVAVGVAKRPANWRVMPPSRCGRSLLSLIPPPLPPRVAALLSCLC